MIVRNKNYTELNDKFFNLMTIPYPHAIIRESLLTTFNTTEKNFTELEDVFFLNRLVFRSKGDFEYVSYEVKKAEDFKPFFSILSARYPSIIEANIDKLKDNIILFKNFITETVLSSDASVLRKNKISVCENEKNSLGLGFNNEMYLKIDYSTNRVLSLRENKLGLWSIPSDDSETMRHLNSIYTFLEINNE